MVNFPSHSLPKLIFLVVVFLPQEFLKVLRIGVWSDPLEDFFKLVVFFIRVWPLFDAHVIFDLQVVVVHDPQDLPNHLVTALAHFLLILFNLME